jgi:hypothetical protein
LDGRIVAFNQGYEPKFELTPEGWRTVKGWTHYDNVKAEQFFYTGPSSNGTESRIQASSDTSAGFLSGLSSYICASIQFALIY